MNDIEEIKSAIRGLLQDAASQGVLIELIRSSAMDTIDGRYHITTIHIEETRTKT